MANKTDYKGVETRHPEYCLNIDKWEKVDDVVASNVRQYLRDVGSNETHSHPHNCDDDHYYQDYRYHQQKAATKRQKEYEEGAILDNFTQKTLNGLCGAAFIKPPTVELQANLEYLADDVDGAGTTIQQQARECVDQDLRKGRIGLLADMPNLQEGEATIANMENGFAVPRINTYYAENITNWRYRRVGSAQLLELVVLRELVQDTDDQFSHEIDFQYRVLALDEEGDYYQQVYDKDGNEGEKIYPRQNGELMRSIPFFFIGIANNTAEVDASPLYPIAELNIGHYRNSADTEENSFVCSQAMLILALSEFIDQEQWQKENPDGVQIGSRRGLNVGSGGSATFIQAQESDKAMRLMEMKKEQAVQLGAQLIQQGSNITAETARIQQSNNHSVLSSIAVNVTSAYRLALEECAKFSGTDYDSEFEVNQEFFFAIMTAQDRAQWMSEILQGISPRTLYYQKLRESGDYPDDWTDEKIDEALREDASAMLGFTGSGDDVIDDEDAE